MCEALTPQLVFPFATSANQYFGGGSYHKTCGWQKNQSVGQHPIIQFHDRPILLGAERMANAEPKDLP
jgi:hypothetical protein